MTNRTGTWIVVAALALGGMAVGQAAPGRGAVAAQGRGAAPARGGGFFGPTPEASAQAQAGQSLFTQQCSFCHGSDAEGASGPDLTQSQLVITDQNGDHIGAVVRTGRPGTPMPAFSFTPTQIQDLAAFLHYRVYVASSEKGQRKGVEPADLQTGNAAAGKAYFNGAGGCSSCHSPTGDLAGVATRLVGLRLEQALLSVPRDMVSTGGGFGRRGAPGPQSQRAIATVHLTLPSGEAVSGKLAYEDDFNIGIMDASGFYHSWPRNQVKFTIDAPGQAHAALLAKYTDADIHNLMAYLQTLTGPAAPAAAAPSDPPSDPPAAPPSTGALADAGVTTAMLLHPPADSWPTYHGDYTARRHTSITQITPANVDKLGLAWQFQTGERSGVKSSPLVVDGVMYFSIPDNVWAIDARTGHMIWHYTYPPNKGSHIGNRGVGMYKNWLFFMSPDGHLVSLDAKDGKVRWIKEVVNYQLGYWTTTAPLVVGNHVLVGTSGDFDNLTGIIRAVDPATGDTQWTFDTTPPPGTPNATTGGNTWMTGSYDPELNLLYWGTGNPTPVLEGETRPGDDPYTCSIVALNPDTGKLVWAFQPSPHDTHDWDAVEAPVLVDGTFDGQPRKMLMQASRNGYFFVLDRTNGKDLLTVPFGPVNWAKGLDSKGQPIPNPDKEPKPDGRLVAPAEGGLTNYRSPSVDAKLGLFLVSASPSYGIYFAKPADGHVGWAGADYGVYSSGVLEAIDYQTGKIRWKHEWTGGSGAGVLTTDSGLTFTADSSGNMEALDTATGKLLWHSGTGAGTSASPMSYELDGRQYIVSSFGGTVMAWALNQ